MHRQDGWHDNLTGHWPLTAGCKELNGLEALLRRKQDFTVILEVAGTGGIPESLDLVRKSCTEGFPRNNNLFRPGFSNGPEKACG